MTSDTRLDGEREDELITFVGSVLNQRGGEAGDDLAVLGDRIMDDSLTPEDIITAHGSPAGFLDEHHRIFELFCDDLNEDAAQVLRHGAAVHSWCVAVARKVQHGEDAAHRVDGAKRAMEWTDDALEEISDRD